MQPEMPKIYRESETLVEPAASSAAASPRRRAVPWLLGAAALGLAGALVWAAAAAFQVETPERTNEERSDNVLGMKFVWCPPGKFLMGSPETDDDALGDETPQVEVELTNGFWLGKYEVTQGEWKALMATEPWKGKPYAKEGADYAASYVEWVDAMSFCNRLTVRELAEGRLEPGWSYQLPSEAVWEYACRAGSRTPYCCGDYRGLEDYAWYGQASWNRGEAYTNRVGLKKSNGWGLHDMHGNVWEWCGDWYREKLAGGRNPTGPSRGSLRVLRGGCWSIVADRCRSAYRAGPPLFLIQHIGFRVVRVPVSW